jgi:hypothetical protein
VKTHFRFAIEFSRLPKVDDSAGLVFLTIGESDGEKAPRRVGALTDVALRGRLAHWNVHSANEVAAIRLALGREGGRITVEEAWSGLDSCLRFWHDFTGSQIRLVEWTCDRCARVHRESLGANVGETISRKCRCGTIKRLTTASPLVPIPKASGPSGPRS